MRKVFKDIIHSLAGITRPGSKGMISAFFRHPIVVGSLVVGD